MELQLLDESRASLAEVLPDDRPVPREAAIRRISMLGDALVVTAALALSLQLNRTLTTRHTLWSIAAIPLMLAMYKLYGLYGRTEIRINRSITDRLPALFHATIVGCVLLWLINSQTSFLPLSNREMIWFGAELIVGLSITQLLTWRVAMRALGPERAVLVGHGHAGEILVQRLHARRTHGVQVIGSLRTESDEASTTRSPLLDLGPLARLADLAGSQGIDRVLVNSITLTEHEMRQLLRLCRTLYLKVSILPRGGDILGPAVELDEVDGLALLAVNPPWLPRSSRLLKRAVDIVVSGTLLLLTAPLMLCTALAVRLGSPGPALFAQERVGRDGRRFSVLKFRTMVTGAESQREALLSLSQDPNWLHLEHDPRVTSIGYHLRRFSIDELPQLWNVFRGDMSMVGPRPLVPVEDERVEEWARGRLDLTPGITGYWQVLGRTTTSFEEMVRLDYLYVMNWSLTRDLRLMARTVPVVLSRYGAN